MRGFTETALKEFKEKGYTFHVVLSYYNAFDREYSKLMKRNTYICQEINLLGFPHFAEALLNQFKDDPTVQYVEAQRQFFHNLNMFPFLSEAEQNKFRKYRPGLNKFF